MKKILLLLSFFAIGNLFSKDENCIKVKVPELWVTGNTVGFSYNTISISKSKLDKNTDAINKKIKTLNEILNTLKC